MCPFHNAILLTITLATVALSLNRGLADGPSVTLDSGAVQGQTLDVRGVAVDAYLGIPFAQPPVGSLRWRPPQPVDPWHEPRLCTAMPPACCQPPRLTYGFTYKRQSEDCLYLNVWTPSNPTGRKLPVMVWIHGGGNVIGGTDTPVYDGRHFAARDVVLVTIQYRLGVLGYFAHPALSAEAAERDGTETSGNYGLLDQIAALKWVQRNIEAFHGDPQCVTVFGESAGAANITHLMASPLAQGLFHRAIAQSGYFGEQTPHLKLASNRAPSAHDSGLAIAKRLGVDATDAEALTALRALPVEKLLDIPVSIGSLSTGDLPERAFSLGPCVDGHVLPEDPAVVWAAGRTHPVPLMAGSLLDDGSVFSRANPIRGLIGYRLAMRVIFGPDTPRALRVFPAATDADVPEAVHRLITILAFRAPARRLVAWSDASGQPAWLYHFSRRPRGGRASEQGVFHGLEIAYVFNTIATFGDETDQALAREMMDRWIAFARHGDPNHGLENAVRWPPYSPATDHHLEFGDTVRVGQQLDREACDLLDARAERNRTGP